MNLLLLFERDRAGDRFRIDDDRGAHLERSGVDVGATLHVGLEDGPRGRASVVARRGARFELEATFDPEPPPRPGTRLVLAMPRPKALRRLLPQLVAFGLDELVILRAWRVERSYLESEVLSPDRLRASVREGMMQGCLTWTPRVVVAPRFLPWVEAEADRRIPGEARWVAHPRAPRLSSPRPHARSALALGPEPGWLDREIESLKGADYRPFSVDAGILRLETAAIAALAQIRLLRHLPGPT